MSSLDLLIIGGGMITNDLLLPAVYHLQRLGRVGRISVCALGSGPLRGLAQSGELKEAFPRQAFEPLPALDTPPEQAFPLLYQEALSRLRPRQAVIVAVPDPLHYEVVTAALTHGQHVLCVKPLVLKYDEAERIEQLARREGLFVGVEYHKRFDRRSLVARRHYAAGDFGRFALGEARLIEPYYYRNSNFQNWFTCERTDPFVYVGCHYVDLVYFITGLRPAAVSVSGVRGRFPNGNEGYMWAHGQVRYEGGALLAVTAGLGYPDQAAGSNDQGLLMYCEGAEATGMIQHLDDERGVRYSFLEPIGCGGSHYNYVSPDFFRLVPWEGPGLRPVGYGYESVAAHVEAMCRIESAAAAVPPAAALDERRRAIAEIDRQGLLATPANSFINELVIEAARLSIAADGAWTEIGYEPRPHVGAAGVGSRS